MKIAIATLGCKVNQYESSQLAGRLAGDYELVEFSEQADVYVVNTCAVTAQAEHKSRQLIFRALRANPEAEIIAAGCYGELAAERLKSAGATAVIGNKDKRNFAEIFRLVQLTNRSKPALNDQPDQASSFKPLVSSRSRAVVKIQDGCDQFCAYCVIPYLRGDLWSRPAAEVINEINMLASMGTNEVVITGIHLGKYGADRDKEITLTGIIERLLSETDIARIRLSSIEPLEVTDELIELMAGSDRLARHLHLPLQSGSDPVLSAMNRPYTSGQYREKAEKLQAMVPDIALTTDILVGFPGETAEQFQETYSLAEDLGFRKIHVFKYSDRPLAPASDLPDKIPANIKSARAAALRELSAGQAEKFAHSHIDKTLKVVLENFKNGFQQGLSTNYLRVKFKSSKSEPGEMASVKITGAKKDVLFGHAE